MTVNVWRLTLPRGLFWKPMLLTAKHVRSSAEENCRPTLSFGTEQIDQENSGRNPENFSPIRPWRVNSQVFSVILRLYHLLRFVIEPLYEDHSYKFLKTSRIHSPPSLLKTKTIYPQVLLGEREKSSCWRGRLWAEKSTSVDRTDQYTTWKWWSRARTLVSCGTFVCGTHWRAPPCASLRVASQRPTPSALPEAITWSQPKRTNPSCR